MKAHGGFLACHIRPRMLLLAVIALPVLFGPPLAGPGSVGAQNGKEQPNGTSRKKSIRGRVVDDTNQPVVGAYVHLAPAGGESGSRNEQLSVRTDEDGGFSFDEIADKPYTVTVIGVEDQAAQYHLPGEEITIRVEKGGVITGRVTNADGVPLAGVPVAAKCIRGKGGKPLPRPYLSWELSRSRITDDRGIYRFWGLQPGVYLVSAGPTAFWFDQGLVTPYVDDAPTYYPSSTLASATQIVVNSGQELTGIDIKYRGYTGHEVSGTMTGNSPPSYLQVYFFTLGGDYVHTISLLGEQIAGPFAFARVSDGDYLLIAVRTTGNEIKAISPPKTVTVKDADVTGINLKPLPLGSLSGRIRLENDPKLDCKPKTDNPLAETVISLRMDAPPKERYPVMIELELTYAATPDSRGQFALKKVPAGNYLIESWLPNEDWYLSAMALGSGAQPLDIGTKGITISQGQTISSIAVVIKNGAASLSGRVVPKSGTALPAGLRVFLIPSEPNRADDRLRFAETEVGSDGSFKLRNLAPGSYHIIARSVKEDDSTRRAADTIEGRTKLLREAGGKEPVIELHACEKKTEHVLILRAG